MSAAPAEHLQAQPVHEDDDGSRAATGFPGFADRLDPPAAGNHAGPGVGDDRFNVEAEVGIAIVPGVGQGQPGADGTDRQDVAERRILWGVQGGNRCGLPADGPGAHHRPRHSEAARAAI